MVEDGKGVEVKVGDLVRIANRHTTRIVRVEKIYPDGIWTKEGFFMHGKYLHFTTIDGNVKTSKERE